MPALKISNRDPELERGEKAAYNLCRVMDDAGAANTWSAVPYRNCDYVVSARVEYRGQPVGGPPLCEMCTAAHLRDATRWSREIARHLARTQSHATFFSFPGKVGRFPVNYVVLVEAVPLGDGRKGHTELMTVLRTMAAAQPRQKSPRRKARRRRKS